MDPKNDQVNENALNSFLNSQKIPESIKGLPTYDGETKSLYQWLRNVDAVVANLEDAPAPQNMQRIWLGYIRNKIVGRASDALIARNQDETWANMRNVLIEYFGDKRDISTLTQSIPYMFQKNKSLDVFYQEINELTTSLNQKICLDPFYDGHVHAVMHFVEIITKNAFIDGLNEPMSSYTRNYKPTTLVDAYQAAQEQTMALVRKRQKDTNLKPQYSNPFNRPQNNQQRNSNFVSDGNSNFQQNFRQNGQRNLQTYVPQRSMQQAFVPQRNTQQAYTQQSMQQNHQTGPAYQNRDTNYDNSMRSRRSNPMSGISYRSGNQINYNEQNNDDTNENTIDDLNFQVDQMEYQNP